MSADSLTNELQNERQKELMTDSCISQSQHVKVGEDLEPWVPDENDPGCPELENIFDNPWNRGWDQFETNATLFGVESTLNEELYTANLESGPQTRELEMEATHLAREIEGEDTLDLHLFEEKVNQSGENLEIDEETQFSSVSRKVDDNGCGEIENILLDSQNGETFGDISSTVIGRSPIDTIVGKNIDGTQALSRSSVTEMIASLIPDTSDDSVLLSEVAESKNSNSRLGIGVKPNFALLNGEIDLDNLSVKVLQETFKATFGRETSVKDKMWLKRRIIMGLTNSCDFSTTNLLLIDNRVVKKGKEETRKNTDCSVSVDFAVTSEVESRERHTCTNKQNGTSTVANGMQTQSYFQENCESKDAYPELRPAKRVRKPTKRFIEEFSEEECRDSGAKIVSLVKHNSKPSAYVCERPVHDFGPSSRCLLREDSLGGSGIQVPYVSRIRRSRPRENFMPLLLLMKTCDIVLVSLLDGGNLRACSCDIQKFQSGGFEISTSLEKNGVSSCKELENESENEVLKSGMSHKYSQEPVRAFVIFSMLFVQVFASSEKRKFYMEKKTIQLKRDSQRKKMRSYKTSSDDEVVTVPTANGGIRRKHHRPWSLSEVVKLVEGVAKYGAGRWSEIKRVAFSSYSYRTSVDLKDKWRNLLKASLAESPTGNGIPSARKQASLPIPAPILSRVRELADTQTHVTPILSSGS
ncbi:Myb family transcription factor family protein [Striga asiatica]|uniref:Myb family transcription factor family protein n=1 Tax=Striga asiatica TaxID=4170 RepID=A0A5A7R4N4_STRAF|nr:Myb family transcription factor family protein [Striga asiatica]